MKKPIKLRNQLEEAEDHERAARLFRVILRAAEKRRQRKRREVEANGKQSADASGQGCG